MTFLQATFWKAFSLMTFVTLWVKFHWNLFPMAQLAINQDWSDNDLGGKQVSHYLNQLWWSLLRHICIIRPQWVNIFDIINTLNIHILSTYCQATVWWIQIFAKEIFTLLQSLTHWGQVTHICITNLDHHWFRQWLVVWMVPSHYLNQCLNIVDWNFE